MKKRNYGIDLLRLISMLMVVILHILGPGGVIENAFSIRLKISWLVYSVCFCAVDVYALISGYVAYSDAPKKYNYFKYIAMWLQVFLYSFGITAIVGVMSPGTVSSESLITSMMVISKDLYWYFTAYSVVFFLSPTICSFVRKASKKELDVFVAVLFAIFSVFYSIVARYVDIFKIEYGYSFSWLLILFVIGAWAKKYDIPHVFSVKRYLLVAILCVFVTWISQTSGYLYYETIMQYTSPFMVVYAFCLLSLFSRMRFSEGVNKIISILSPAAFGVYLIHLQFYVWNEFVVNKFAWITISKPILVPFKIVYSAGKIFIVCLIIDLIRIQLFKIIGINKLVKMLGDKFC